MKTNKVLLKLGIPLVGLAVGAIVLLIVFFILGSWWSSPPSVLGFSVFGLDEGPEQPIDFPHVVHVQGVGLDCQFCHRTASTSEAAGIPPVQQCMFCHSVITGGDNAEIAKLRDAFFGTTTAEGEKVPPQPINWVRVHRLPDHVQFVHEVHIGLFTDLEGDRPAQLEVRARASQEGISLMQAACSTCHGDVGSMVRVEQVRNLKMRDCVDCHRANNAPTDCSTCHY